jgi:hypothetical protein
MRVTGLSVSLILILAAAGLSVAQPDDPGAACVTCHTEWNPGLVKQWKDSDHGAAEVGCIDCHGAAEGDVDAFEHHGVLIATLVTPKDCGQCHEQEAEEASNSYHATAGQILDSADAYLAHVVGGLPVAIIGCEGCHGAKVEIDPDSPNKLARNSWPNSGIGRINPDGSLGSCNACHTRHGVTKAQARQPEACSKCHLGPDHPQIEVYTESKHGNVYYTNTDKMNLESDRWIVGHDYSVAPTCATCHMSATRNQAVTHDVGQRIAWTLRPPVSNHTEDWETKRSNMNDVCSACHGAGFTDGHFHQFDAFVRLYNEKFAKPATEIMEMVRGRALMKNKASFSNKLEWIYWELWHHEGRRARHGAAMMGPDYAWWHGIYEVGQHFYFKFLPEARKYGDEEVNGYIDKLLTEDPMHRWMSQETGELKEAIRSGKMQQLYEEMYE